MTFSVRMEANTILDNPIIIKKRGGLTAYIARYTIINLGVMKDVPQDMELEI
jgi:hypothetical protein